MYKVFDIEMYYSLVVLIFNVNGFSCIEVVAGLGFFIHGEAREEICKSEVTFFIWMLRAYT